MSKAEKSHFISFIKHQIKIKVVIKIFLILVKTEEGPSYPFKGWALPQTNDQYVPNLCIENEDTHVENYYYA